MTRARRTLQRLVFPRGLGLAGAALLLALGVAGALRAGTTERIVANSHTGLAIDGYDPVAYFVNGDARLGSAEHEFSFAGAVWRFRNEGNQAAFAANPEVYAPCFGGHDPVGIARGIARPGHPRVFAITGGTLCLFFSEEARTKFLADPRQMKAAADARWPEVSATLAE